MEKRIPLAIFLSLLLLFAYQWIFPPPPIDRNAPSSTGDGAVAVSYTHLTLPTMCVV